MLTLAMLALILFGNPTAPARETPSDCGFSKLDPRLMPHFVERHAVKRVKPPYPEDAKARGLTGAVRIRILVDKRGSVVHTCPVSVPAEAQADGAFVAAAEAAARQWVFRPNFGFPKNVRPRGIRYVDAYLVFRFALPEEQ
jgi:TonB family protein